MRPKDYNMPNYYIFDRNFNLKLQKKSFSREKKKSKLSLVKYTDIGYYIITPLLVGVFLGLAIDKFLKTKSTFFLIFLFLGTVAVFYNMYKIYKDGK